MCSAENAIDMIRQRLTTRREFSIYDAFKTLDRYDKGMISMPEFRQIFDDYGIFTSRQDIETLVDRYDQDKDGRVSFGDFFRQMSPKSLRPLKY